MTEFRIVHEFATSPETFWELFFDEEYNSEFYGCVGVIRRRLTLEEQGSTTVVTAAYSSERQLPGFVRKLTGNTDFGFVETLTFHRSDGYVEQRIEPSFMRDRTTFVGTIELDEPGPGRVRRTYAGSIDVRIPVVGRRIERATVKDMHRTHDQAAEVTRAWLGGLGRGALSAG